MGVAGMMTAAGVPQAAEIEKIHFLIPGGAGGGWDGTARGTGEALTKAGIVGTATYENMSGGGGGKASRSEEHTSELQSRRKLVCRLLLEKKNNQTAQHGHE